MGTIGETGVPRYSHNWALARRNWFKIYDDHFTYDDWHIPFASIDKATLHRVRQMFVPGQVLHLKVGEKSYQFGFNPWCRIDRHLPVAFELVHSRLRHSAFCLTSRAFALTVLGVYLV